MDIGPTEIPKQFSKGDDPNRAGNAAREVATAANPTTQPKTRSMTLPDQAIEALRDIAKRPGFTDLNEALLQAIADEQLLLDQLDEGSRVLIQKPDATFKEVVVG